MVGKKGAKMNLTCMSVPAHRLRYIDSSQCMRTTEKFCRGRHRAAQSPVEIASFSKQPATLETQTQMQRLATPTYQKLRLRFQGCELFAKCTNVPLQGIEPPAPDQLLGPGSAPCLRSEFPLLPPQHAGM